MRLYEVVWRDAFSDAVDRWMQVDELETEPRVITTVGYVFKDRIPGYLSVVQSVDEACDSVSHVIHIPTATVVRVTERGTP